MIVVVYCRLFLQRINQDCRLLSNILVVNLSEFVPLRVVGHMMMEFDIGLFLFDKPKSIYHLMLYSCCFLSCAALWEMIKFRYQTLSTDHNSILIFLHIFKLIHVKSYHKGMVSENIEIHKILRTLLGLCKHIVSIALKAYRSIIIRNVYKIVHKHPRPPSFRCFVLLWNPVCLSVCQSTMR